MVVAKQIPTTTTRISLLEAFVYSLTCFGMLLYVFCNIGIKRQPYSPVEYLTPVAAFRLKKRVV
jgi:hypothetical protein